MKKWILVLALLLVSVPVHHEISPSDHADLGEPK